MEWLEILRGLAILLVGSGAIIAVALVATAVHDKRYDSTGMRKSRRQRVYRNDRTN